MNKRQTETLRVAPDGRTWCGAGWHRQEAGIHILHLQGTPYEMGRQHGALLKDQIPEGPIFYFRDYVEKLVRSSGLGALTPLVRGLLRQTVGRTVARKLPEYARASIQGMADGSGLKHADVLDGCTMPDSLMWVVARMIQARRVGPAVQHRLALSLGCTSAMAWGDATADGRLLHARNLDYHGVESWPKHTAVIFHTPDVGHRYVSVASAGVLMGGATAMNDQGLTLTLHQHMFTDGTKLGGTPIGTVGDQVMREAATLEEAEVILRQHKPIGCWTYLIADGKTNEVLCFEENPRRQVAHRVGRDEGRFGYANIYLDAELGATERDLVLSWDELRALPMAEVTVDLHCVTKWSAFDTTWRGVRLSDLFALAGMRPEVTHLLAHAEGGYTTNLPIEAALADDALLAVAYEGGPIPPEHGYPARTLIPSLYLWKSAKWVRGLELLVGDRPGFWEENGYHAVGDPFAEQRFHGD